MWLAILYAIAGLIACLLIITIPFGLQAFKLALFSLWPFGRMLVKKPTAGGASVVGNVLWFVLFGWWLAVGHLVTALLQALTIIGLPLAAANAKLVGAALWPMGREIVPTAEVTAALEAYRAEGIEVLAIEAEPARARAALPSGSPAPSPPNRSDRSG